jgi:hypothetical protein
VSLITLKCVDHIPAFEHPVNRSSFGRGLYDPPMPFENLGGDTLGVLKPRTDTAGENGIVKKGVGQMPGAR